MARTIYIVNATQVVTSESHPEGMFSVKSGYPKTFDSATYAGDAGRAFEVAEAEYRSCESAMLLDTNPTRVMQTITLERSDGVPYYHRSKGAFPVVQPQPEPEPEEPENEPAE